MPRRPRLCPPGFPCHVIQRGINRRTCFTCESDRIAYAHWLEEAADKFEVAIHAWVFMDNHVHLLLTPEASGGISRLMQYIGRLYVRRFNDRYARSGGLFEGRFKSHLVDSDRYVLACMRYIEMNPVRAGITSDPGQFKWSSFTAHAKRLKPSMWTPHASYLALGKLAEARATAYRRLCSTPIASTELATIRHCINKGHILGSEAFRHQVEEHIDGGFVPDAIG